MNKKKQCEKQLAALSPNRAPCRNTLARVSLDPKHRASLGNTFCLLYTQTSVYCPATAQAVHIIKGKSCLTNLVA